MIKVFRWALPSFLAITALVVGGAWYQTISIVPFWQQHISMFKNYGHWGTGYFPILSPLMTVLWLIVLITGLRVKSSNKTILYIGHFLFLVIMVSTLAYFAPFLLTYMGHPNNNISDQQLVTMLDTWAKWDYVRQIVGLVVLFIFIQSYGKVEFVTNSRPEIGNRQ